MKKDSTLYYGVIATTEQQILDFIRVTKMEKPGIRVIPIIQRRNLEGTHFDRIYVVNTPAWIYEFGRTEKLAYGFISDIIMPGVQIYKVDDYSTFGYSAKMIN